jgi:hypothetical protein
MLRAFAAGLFVFAGLMATIAILGVTAARGGWLPRAVIITSGAALMVAAMRFFNPKGSHWLSGGDPKWLEHLERDGLVVDTTFHVTRAFGADDWSDQVPHYFLELADGGGTLVMVGQYLYDYEPIDDDPELNRSRRFPCTAFTVRRHRRHHYVVDVVCTGTVIEPEVIAPGRIVEAWTRDGFTPRDGEILTDISFDELKRLRTQAR